MAKDTFYFSHDYSARMDEKIRNMMHTLQEQGWAAYGIYWALIEDLYNNANALRTHYDRIAYDMRVEKTLIKRIIEEFELFEIDGEIFSSNSVKRRLEERQGKSIKAKESANKRWEKCERNANAMRTHNNRNAIKERKGKDIKEIKKESVKENSPVLKLEIFIPTLDFLETVPQNYQEWLELQSMQRRLGKEMILKRFTEWAKERITEKSSYKDPADFLRHFTNTANKNPDFFNPENKISNGKPTAKPNAQQRTNDSYLEQLETLGELHRDLVEREEIQTVHPA